MYCKRITHNNDAPFLSSFIVSLSLIFPTKFYMFKDLSLESRNIQTQNCAPIQCTVWPRNAFLHEPKEDSQLD